MEHLIQLIINMEKDISTIKVLLFFVAGMHIVQLIALLITKGDEK